MTERKRRSRSAARRKGSARPFWGDAQTAAGPHHEIRPITHPTALIDSLGAPPFPRADPAPHYFAAVYQRATGMALALAHAYGIVEPDADDDRPSRDAPAQDPGGNGSATA
jgi:hypothetical protein